MNKVFVKKSLEDLADEIYRRSPDASGVELFDIISDVMRKNRDNPNDVILRAKIGKIFKELYRSVAC